MTTWYIYSLYRQIYSNGTAEIPLRGLLCTVNANQSIELLNELKFFLVSVPSEVDLTNEIPNGETSGRGY